MLIERLAENGGHKNRGYVASVSHQLDERQNDLVSELIAVQKAPKIGPVCQCSTVTGLWHLPVLAGSLPTDLIFQALQGQFG